MFCCSVVSSIRWFGARQFSTQFSTQLRNKKPTFVLGLDKNERKKLKKKLNLISTEMEKQQHLYKLLYNWKSPEDLAMHLIDSEVYNSGGLIVLNKPYGVGTSPAAQETNPSITSKLHGGPTDVPSLTEVLPILQEHYKASHLDIIIRPERWASGVTMLSSSTSLSKRISKSFRSFKALKQPHMTYVAITLGKPSPEEDEAYLGFKTVPSQKGSVPMLVENTSRAMVKQNLVKTNRFEHKLLDYSEEFDASLIMMKVLNDRNHVLRLYAARLASPILGDSLYGYRVQKLLGKRVKVNPMAATYAPPNIDENVLKALGLNLGLVEGIPCHMHLGQVQLDAGNLFPKQMEVEVAQHFAWTADCLGLSYTEEEAEAYGRDDIDEHFSTQWEETEGIQK